MSYSWLKVTVCCAVAGGAVAGFTEFLSRGTASSPHVYPERRAEIFSTTGQHLNDIFEGVRPSPILAKLARDWKWSEGSRATCREPAGLLSRSGAFLSRSVAQLVKLADVLGLETTVKAQSYYCNNCYTSMVNSSCPGGELCIYLTYTTDAYGGAYNGGWQGAGTSQCGFGGDGCPTQYQLQGCVNDFCVP